MVLHCFGVQGGSLWGWERRRVGWGGGGFISGAGGGFGRLMGEVWGGFVGGDMLGLLTLSGM